MGEASTLDSCASWPGLSSGASLHLDSRCNSPGLCSDEDVELSKSLGRLRRMLQSAQSQDLLKLREWASNWPRKGHAALVLRVLGGWVESDLRTVSEDPDSPPHLSASHADAPASQQSLLPEGVPAPPLPHLCVSILITPSFISASSFARFLVSL